MAHLFKPMENKGIAAKSWWEMHVATQNARAIRVSAQPTMLSPRAPTVSPRSMAPNSLTPRRRQARNLPPIMSKDSAMYANFPPMAASDAEASFYPSRSPRLGKEKGGNKGPAMPEVPKMAPKPVTKAAGQAPAAAPAAAAKPSAEVKALRSKAEEAIYSRFKHMMQAFKYIDVNNSGAIDKEEIRRAITLWNIPIDDAFLDEFMRMADTDGDGSIKYEEFVDALARETVNPEAMGKRGMNAMEAFGVDNIDREFLGKDRKIKNVQYVNPLQVDFNSLEQQEAKKFSKKDMTGVKNMAQEAVASHFKDARAAFKQFDKDNSGTLSVKEIAEIWQMSNLPLDGDYGAKLMALFRECDRDGDGQIGYEEFVDGLVRDTVAPDAMGKRDMNAYEAFGVHDLDPEFLHHARKLAHA